MDRQKAGDNIRRLRKTHNLSQQQLAKALNISAATLSGYETGKKAPLSSTLAKMAIIFNTSVDSILGYQPDAEDTLNS